MGFLKQKVKDKNVRIVGGDDGGGALIPSICLIEMRNFRNYDLMEENEDGLSLK